MEWIKYSERLPETEGNYLIIPKNKYEDEILQIKKTYLDIGVAYFDGEDFIPYIYVMAFNSNAKIIMKDVIYWMPLPPCPTAEGD